MLSLQRPRLVSVRDRKKATTTTAGVLRPAELARHVELARLPCHPTLSPWIENYWILRWELPAGASYVSSTLPHPACTLSVEHGHTREGVVEPVVVTGVLTRRFDVTLAGSGWVLGAKFRPGGFAAFTSTDARALRDVPVAPATAFVPGTVAALAALGPSLRPDESRSRMDELLLPYEREVEQDYSTVLDVIEVMLHDRSLVRVQQVEDLYGITSRRMQRLFEKYVGATPKWVLARYRIHDAVSDLDNGYVGSLADLAARYGWFDQAHFTRQFTELVGMAPSTYSNGAHTG